jgi:hypothetical protein
MLPRSSEAPEPEKKKAVAAQFDPTGQIKKLQDQVLRINTSKRDVQKLILSEDPSAKAKSKALKEEIQGWIVAWDAIFEPYRKDGILPQEFKGYQSARTQMNQILEDLLKSTGFDE